MYHVTRDHIMLGVKNSRFTCPIALCMNEAHNTEVMVGNDTLFCAEPLSEYAKEHKNTKNKNTKTYMLSESIADWIKEYDKGQPVDEITLEVHGMYICQEGEPHG